jgi:asparagine synthase (glutamine-hydrolysing)
MEPKLPREILYRPKMGFAVPLATWFRGPLRERLRDSILRSSLLETGFFNVAYLERLVREHQSGLHDHSAPLWSLLMFEAFLRRIGGLASTRPAGDRRPTAEAVVD